jgi:type I restriction enzyme S subunit
MKLVSDRSPGLGASPDGGDSRTQKNDWEQTTLGSLCGERGKSIEPNRQPNQTFELYSVPSFPSGRPEIVLGEQIGSNKQSVTPRSVLLCKINPRINRAWVVGDFRDHPKIASTEWIIFPESESIEPSFLCYFLQQNTVRDFLAANASGIGGSLMRVKASTLRDFPFSYPERDEQRRIVAEIEKQFTRLDAGVASLKRVQIALKRYRASVLKAACEGRLVPTEAELARKEHRSYQTGEQLLQCILKERHEKWNGKGKFKQPAARDIEQLTALPEGWGRATAGELFDCIVPNRDKPKTFTGEIPWITLPDFSDRTRIARTSSGLGLTASEVTKYKARLIPVGSVVMSCIGRFGLAAVLDRDAVINQQLHAFLIPDFLPAEYFVYALKSQKSFMENVATSTTIAYLNKTNCNNVPIPLPPLAEQTRIVAEVESRLSVVEELEAVVNADLQRAKCLRQSILQNAFCAERSKR